MSTLPKFYRSTDSGAPVSSGINNTAGELITVLDDCLVNGYGSVTLDSLVVASNVATGTISTGHGFTMTSLAGPVITIGGATPSGLNGEWRIASVPGSTTFTFATTGISDQTATGTITAKRSPAGWVKSYSGTNKAVYRSQSILSNQHYLRVDDSVGAYARVRGYASMSDVDTGTDPFPTDAQVNGGGYAMKAASSSRKAWIVYADDRFLYFISNYDNLWYGGLGFGDLIKGLGADAFSTVLCTQSSSTVTYGLSNAGAGLIWLPRGIGQSGTAVAGNRYQMGRNGAILGTGSEELPVAATAYGIRLAQVEIWDSGTVFRGIQPGVWSTSSVQAQGATLEDFSGVLAGRTLIQQLNAGTGNGFYVDLTGPWYD